jgi:hypothetical protein
MLLAARLRVHGSQNRSIVAIHGLNGHREKTWMTNGGVSWLRDLLPHDLLNARILSWGYDANTHSGSRVSCQYLFNHAQTLVSDPVLEEGDDGGTQWTD